MIPFSCLSVGEVKDFPSNVSVSGVNVHQACPVPAVNAHSVTDDLEGDAQVLRQLMQYITSRAFCQSATHNDHLSNVNLKHNCKKARDNLTWDLRIPPSREPPVDTGNGRYGGRRGGR